MKNTFFVLGTAVLFLIGIIIIPGCNSSGGQKQATEEVQEHDEYHEHMEGVEHEHADGEGHMTMYACPMHPDQTSDKPGKCPKCGMDMEKVEKSDNDYEK